MEHILEGLLEEFTEKVVEAVAHHFHEEPRQEVLWFGQYNRGTGTRISIEDKFSIDVSFDHLENGDETLDTE